jgi:hypothetical protein
LNWSLTIFSKFLVLSQIFGLLDIHQDVNSAVIFITELRYLEALEDVIFDAFLIFAALGFPVFDLRQL